MERQLATVRMIKELRPITGADQIELAIIDGWQCVVKKGDFNLKQLVVFLEIDSWVPTELAPFLSKGAKVPKVFEGVEGNRLRSIRLRGELSQGLVLPLMVALEAAGNPFKHFVEGEDVTELLGIKKWERPLNPQLQGQARGYFPSFIRKTDQERIQNLYHKLTETQKSHLYEVTLKLDGSSCTFFHNQGEIGVCSRNLELKVDEDNANNAFVKKFIELNLENKLKALGANIAIQGELYGSGINGNWESLSDIRFAVFDIWDIDGQCYFDAKNRRQIATDLGLESVPVITYLTLGVFESLEEYLNYADRPSLYNNVAEGIVLKSVANPNFSFKVINNKYLLEGGE